MPELSQTMGDEEDDPFDEYDVVRNVAGDHSIWPTVKDLPPGWEAVGVKGSKATCLDWIDKHWSGPSLNL